MNIDGITDLRIIKKAISKLQLGDPISKLHELVKNEKIEKHPLPKGVDRFITSINIEIESNQENDKRKTFDRIRVTCGIVSSLEFFNELNDDRINAEKTIKNKQLSYIKTNLKDILQKILDKIKIYGPFKKYGIPINFLKIENATLKNDSSVVIIIELRQLGQDGESNALEAKGSKIEKLYEDYTQ